MTAAPLQRNSWWLLAAGIANAAIAALHVVVIFVGAPAYRYFGAGEPLARQAELGSYVPPLLTLVISISFAVFAWYGLAGAGVGRRPPLLRAGLIVIATIFFFRGGSATTQLVTILTIPGTIPIRYFVFSCLSLLLGLCYAAGTWTRWRALESAA